MEGIIGPEGRGGVGGVGGGAACRVSFLFVHSTATRNLSYLFFRPHFFLTNGRHA